MTTKISAIDWPTVLKMLAGGALTGAGVGAGTSLLRHLNSLNEQAQQDQDHSADDNVLYLNIPEKKPQGDKYASANNPATFALSGLAGLAGAYGGYNLVRNKYQQIKKRQLQAELDKAHQIYLDELYNPQMKSASQFGMLSKGIGTGYLALLLTALGSGVAANKLLQKQFPPLQSPYRDKPRKIVIRSVDPKTHEPIGDEDVENPVSPDAMEGLVRTHMSNGKSASMDCGFHDLVAAAANGRCDEIKDNLRNHGLDVVLNLVKGARFEKCSSVDRNLAVSWICYDPMVSEAIKPVLGAEFYSMSPGICKLASYIPREFQNDLLGLVESSTREVRGATYGPLFDKIKVSVSFAKESSLPEYVAAGVIENALFANTMKGLLEKEKGQQEENSLENKSLINGTPSQDSPDTEQRTPRTTFEIDDAGANDFAGRYGKLIDKSISKI